METTHNPESAPRFVSRAWYGAPITEFLESDSDAVLGRLVGNSDFAVIQTQREAWIWQIQFLKGRLDGLDGWVFLEFNIPRMGRRVDTVIVIGPVVFVVEFKVGEQNFDRGALDQVWDYALDLKNFHEASHNISLIPVLIATTAPEEERKEFVFDPDNVAQPVGIDSNGFRDLVARALKAVTGAAVDAGEWVTAPYHPTPTIVEAARALYSKHTVEDIARFDASARNLRITSKRIEEVLFDAKQHGRKVICFVTGVPGAGKTLVGLNVATKHRDTNEATHAVFLSGNGPLVAVLREALTRDEVTRRKAKGEKVRKGKVADSIKAFIQNVHHFRDDGLKQSTAPIERVVIFDEAQRAWNQTQTANFMRRKKNQPDFAESEPEFLISVMNRHIGWAVIICLVGGGQEINTGEAGIGAWLDAVNNKFPHWNMYISSRLVDSEYAAGDELTKLQNRSGVNFDDALHLSISLRSFRAENVSSFVKALLDCDRNEAQQAFSKLARRYPVTITRDLGLAKQWIRKQARGSERFGIVASSKAQRLKPHAIDIRVDVDPVHWFLNGKDDTRSSYYLEDAATEFQVQGLELDWACVTWDGDLRFTGQGWSFHDFRGDRWCNISNLQNRNYLRNAYRVLLTRARQGMVVFVPKGDDSDATRTSEYYDSTFNYLKELGIPVLEV